MSSWRSLACAFLLEGTIGHARGTLGKGWKKRQREEKREREGVAALTLATVPGDPRRGEDDMINAVPLLRSI